MDEFLALQAVDACSGWLGGVVLLAIGLFALRPASNSAGFLLAGAGGLKFVLNCCASIPGFYVASAGYTATIETAVSVMAVVVPLVQLGVGGLVIASAVVASKDLLAGRAAGGSS